MALAQVPPGPRSQEKPSKPTLRGVSHQYACIASLPAGAALVASCPTGRAAAAAAVYCTSLSLLLGVSALYHVPTWSPPARLRLRKLDHSSIFLLIAGTYTPLCVLAMGPASGPRLLAMVWTGAAAGVLQTLAWPLAPRPIKTGLYLLLGWLVVAYGREVYAALGPGGAVPGALGGLLYTVGGVVYGARWPNPWPATFGHHEIFHAFVIAASVCHFYMVALLVGRARGNPL